MATRFYLPSSGAAAVSPAYAAWTDTSQAGSRLKAVTTKISSSMASTTVIDNDGNPDARTLWRQFVSDPIPAQTINGTVKAQIRVTADSVTMDRVGLCIKVVSNDGSTLRGTLLALGEYVAANDFAGSLTNRKGADGDTVSSVVAQANDRIVIEIGCVADSTLGAFEVTADASFGDDSGTDLPENETETAANNPWVEFSQNLFTQTATPDPVGGAGGALLAGVMLGLAAVGGVGGVPLVNTTVFVAEAVGGVGGVPFPDASADAFDDPQAITSQLFQAVRATSPANLGDEDASTYVEGTETPALPAATGLNEVVATAMTQVPPGEQFPVISHVVFRALAWVVDIGPVAFFADKTAWPGWPTHPNSRMGWTVGANSAESPLINDDPAVGAGKDAGGDAVGFVFTKDADGISSGDALRPDYYLHTADILTQPNGSPWTWAAINALTNVAVRYSWDGASPPFSSADLEVAEIWIEVYGPIGPSAAIVMINRVARSIVMESNLQVTPIGG